MPTGTVVVARSRSEVIDRLKPILAGANCQILKSSNERVLFRHGTHLTQTASLLPKECSLELHEANGKITIHYTVSVVGFARVWLIIVAVVFFWAIFPPVLIHRALVHHPRQFVENMLSGI